jgi:hypothetical protein
LEDCTGNSKANRFRLFSLRMVDEWKASTAFALSALLQNSKWKFRKIGPKNVARRNQQANPGRRSLKFHALKLRITNS